MTLIAAVAYRRSLPWPAAPVLALTGLALIARPIGGHMSQQTLGSLLDAAHVLAAATWFGMLTALALTARSRGAWASLLPRYSTIAWRCVWVLAATGLINAAVRLGGIAPLVTTGYGRVVLAKVVALAGLLAAGGGCAARGWARRPHTGSTPTRHCVEPSANRPRWQSHSGWPRLSRPPPDPDSYATEMVIVPE